MVNQNILEILVYFIYSISMIMLGIWVNKKLYKNVKNEEHLEKGKIIQRIMKTHSMIQCIAWPCLIVTAFLLKMNKHLHLDIIPRSYVGYAIVIVRFFTTLNETYGGFNSLIMAISRYLCIVYQDAVEGYGVRKLRKVLIGSSIGIPIFLAILWDALVPVEDIWEVLFFPNSTISHGSNTSSMDENVISEMLQSPIYLVTNACVPSVPFYTSKFICTVVLVLIHSNVLEGTIYLHTYIYYNR